jgi:hypothetical protein
MKKGKLHSTYKASTLPDNAGRSVPGSVPRSTGQTLACGHVVGLSFLYLDL